MIEVMVVIAIFGLLASIVIASTTLARARAYDVSRRSTLSQMRTALLAYKYQNSTFPDLQGSANPPITSDQIVSGNDYWSQLWADASEYMQNVPAAVPDNNNYPYKYFTYSDNQKAVLIAYQQFASGSDSARCNPFTNSTASLKDENHIFAFVRKILNIKPIVAAPAACEGIQFPNSEGGYDCYITVDPPATGAAIGTTGPCTGTEYCVCFQ